MGVVTPLPDVGVGTGSTHVNHAKEKQTRRTVTDGPFTTTNNSGTRCGYKNITESARSSIDVSRRDFSMSVMGPPDQRPVPQLFPSFEKENPTTPSFRPDLTYYSIVTFEDEPQVVCDV